eukprot:3085163-Prymnesium_polylepis.1
MSTLGVARRRRQPCCWRCPRRRHGTKSFRKAAMDLGCVARPPGTTSQLPRQSSYLREDNHSLLFGCEDN